MLEYSLFRRLPIWSQAEMLKKQGTVLAQREHKQWVVSLYSLHNRFVELWEKDGIQITTTFHDHATTMAIAEPYLDTLDVQHLLLDS